MIKEAYCSYEISKLLKEKGFDVPTTHWYNVRKSLINDYLVSYENFSNPEKVWLAPTHQMACAWLRKVYHTFIEISTSIDLNGNYHFSYTILDKECKYVRRGYTDFDWNYEDAIEAALKYVLENLI